jgi:hypothetical protein
MAAAVRDWNEAADFRNVFEEDSGGNPKKYSDFRRGGA